jgi:hypothetical protein
MRKEIIRLLTERIVVDVRDNTERYCSRAVVARTGSLQHHCQSHVESDNKYKTTEEWKAPGVQR